MKMASEKRRLIKEEVDYGVPLAGETKIIEDARIIFGVADGLDDS